MATQPDPVPDGVPPPDRIEPQSPPEIAPPATPAEAPPGQPPEIVPQGPDFDQPDRAVPELPPAPDQQARSAEKDAFAQQPGSFPRKPEIMALVALDRSLQA